MDSREFRRITSFHESGHAFADWAAGCRLFRIDMTVTENPTVWYRAAKRSTPRLRIAAYLAGPFSQRRVCHDRSLLEQHAKSDFRRAYRAAEEVFGTDRAAVTEYVMDTARQTDRLLDDCDVWRAITALAEVLQTVPTLSGERAVAILEACYRVQQIA